MIILIVILIITIGFLAIKTQYSNATKVVKIGVIDSLLDSEHLAKFDVVSSKRIVGDPVMTEHGSTVLSIIKQNNNKAQIYYVSLLDSNLKADIDDVVKAIYWCVDNNVDIINMSFATTDDDINLRKAVQFALDRNIIIIASCINDYDGYSYPANYKGVISVSDGKLGKPNIIVKKQIYSVKTLSGSIIEASGTSCATAHVTNQLSLELVGKKDEHVIKLIKK